MHCSSDQADFGRKDSGLEKLEKDQKVTFVKHPGPAPDVWEAREVQSA